MIGLLCGLTLVPPGVSRAADSQALEYQVKAAFLLNFTKFIDWPPTQFEDAASPIAICILGDDPFGQALDQIVEGETVGGRKLVIERLPHPPAKTCSVLFVSRSGKDIPKILASVDRGVLTVGEGEAFLREGGMIAFVIENRRVRFDVSQSAAGKAALKISSKLLNVARTVER